VRGRVRYVAVFADGTIKMTVNDHDRYISQVTDRCHDRFQLFSGQVFCRVVCQQLLKGAYVAVETHDDHNAFA
jgi:hypothetical protein